MRYSTLLLLLMSSVLFTPGCKPDHASEKIASSPHVSTPISKLHRAIASGDIAAVKEELKATGQINKKYPEAWCINKVDLHSNTGDSIHGSQGETPIFVAIRCQALDMVQYLVEEGADISLWNDAGATPLHIAAAIDNPALITLLITLGAEVNIRTAQNKILLLEKRGKSDAEIYEEETDFALNRTGETPLYYAALYNCLAVAPLLLEKGADPNLASRVGFTPLHAAAMGANTKILRILLEEGANPNARSSSGYTPLHIAAENPNIFGASKMKRIEIMQLLLEKTGDVHVKDANGRTPLHHAVRSRSSDLAKALMRLGADKNIPDKNGVSPAQLAQEIGLDWLR